MKKIFVSLYKNLLRMLMWLKLTQFVEAPSGDFILPD